MHTLEILLNSIPATINLDENKYTLHQTVATLLFSILKKIQYLVRKPTRILVEKLSDEQDFLNFFPSLPTNYLIPLYEKDSGETTSKCTKLYPKHQRFSPGLLIIACQHKYCYGFEIMSSRESTILVYNLLLRKFKIPPAVIIYDNACNLNTTCTMRDPQLFKNTTFLVDRFHSQNHTCNPIFSMKIWNSEDMQQINSQICEQLFSKFRRIATQIAYMRVENVYFTSRYFLAIWNMNIK